MNMTVLKRALAGFTGLGLVMAAQAAHAVVDPSYGGQGTDKFTVTAGWVMTKVNGDIGLNGTLGNGTPIDINPDSNSKNANSFSASGNWRITNKNRVSLLWYKTGRDRSFTLQNPITVGDTTIPAGASADSSFSTNYFFVNYRYSFIKKDNLELAGVLGLYGANLKFDLSASKYPGNPSASFSTNESTGLPLPIIGGSFDWYITPRWSAATSLAGLKAKIGDIDGSTWVLTASTDYMLFHNFGVGLAYIHTDINVDVTKKNFNGNVNFNTNSFLLYGVVKF